MLVLSRRMYEKIMIDDGRISIQIVGIDRNQIKLGITAPANISVDREELFLEKEASRAKKLEGYK